MVINVYDKQHILRFSFSDRSRKASFVPVILQYTGNDTSKLNKVFYKLKAT